VGINHINYNTAYSIKDIVHDIEYFRKGVFPRWGDAGVNTFLIESKNIKT
jgi:hypothetical protein